MDVDWAALWRRVEGQFQGNVMGMHGAGHWRQVERHGVMLAEKNGLTGADVVVVRLFAVLHDSQRINEGRDEGHGARGAVYAKTLEGVAFAIGAARVKVLVAACAGHELGKVTEEVVMGTCWDADRLDLVRVGARPREALMSTGAGKEAARRGVGR